MELPSAEVTRHHARWAGLLYGAASSVAPFAYLYVPGRVLVSGDALETATRVRDHGDLLRASIGAELYSAVAIVFAALAFYELWRRTDGRIARAMLAMMLISVPISFVSALIHAAPLLLLGTPSIVSATAPEALAGQVVFFLRLHNHALLVNQIFWGLWLFPIGLLVQRSGLFPRWLAWPLFAAGTGYVLNSLGGLLLPTDLRWLTSSLQVLGVGELPFFTFYLLIWGTQGRAADRWVVALVLAVFVLGMAALVTLMSHRIEASTYAWILQLKLALTVALVLRWRVVDRRGAAYEVAA